MITQERLKQLLHYQPETGVFTWIVSRRGVSAGSVAGNKHQIGYIQIGVDGKLYRAHRLAFMYMTGAFPSNLVDHANGVRDDNRFDNLREATLSENRCNAVMGTANTSGCKGVYWLKRDSVWAAKIRYDNKAFYLGRYDSFEEAAEAVRLKRSELHKEFANHG